MASFIETETSSYTSRHSSHDVFFLSEIRVHKVAGSLEIVKQSNNQRDKHIVTSVFSDKEPVVKNQYGLTSSFRQICTSKESNSDEDDRNKSTCSQFSHVMKSEVQEQYMISDTKDEMGYRQDVEDIVTEDSAKCDKYEGGYSQETDFWQQALEKIIWDIETENEDKPNNNGEGPQVTMLSSDKEIPTYQDTADPIATKQIEFNKKENDKETADIAKKEQERKSSHERTPEAKTTLSLPLTYRSVTLESEESIAELFQSHILSESQAISLLKHNPQLASSNNSQTIISIASDRSWFQVIKTLLNINKNLITETNIIVEIVNSLKHTPLLSENDLAILRSLFIFLPYASVDYLQEHVELNLALKNGNTLLHYAAWCGDKNSLSTLLKAGCDPNQQNHKGDTPMHITCKLSHLSIASDLCKVSNCLIQNNKGDTPLHISLSNQAYQEQLQSMILSIVTQFDPTLQNISSNTVLHLICEKTIISAFHLKSIMSHPKVGQSLNIRNKSGLTALDLVVAKCFQIHGEINYPYLELLLKQPESITWMRQNSPNLLLKCFKSDNDKLLFIILSHPGCDPNNHLSKGNTILHFACSLPIECLNCIKLVLPLAHQNLQNNQGNLPLHVACRKCKVDILQVFAVYRDFNTKVTNDNGLTPLMEAILTLAKRGNTVLPDVLYQLFPEEIYFKDNVLHVASRTMAPFNAEKVLANLKHSHLFRTALFACNGDNLTPLQTAIKNLRFENAALFLSASNTNQSTLLHCASKKSILHHSLKVLLADPSMAILTKSVDKYGNTPLHIACLNHCLNSIKLLGTADKTILTYTNLNGETPLHLACMRNSFEAVVFLLQIAPKALKIPDKDGWLPLHHTCQLGNIKLAETLLQFDDDPVNSIIFTNADHKSPFHIACLYNGLLVQSILSKYRLPSSVLTLPDRKGNTPVHLCLRLYENKVPAVKEILEQIEELPLTENAKKKSILHICIESNETLLLQKVLEKTAHHISCQKLTELVFYAVKRASLTSVKIKILLNFHLQEHEEAMSTCHSMTDLDETGMGLIHYVVERGDLPLFQFLVEEVGFPIQQLNKDGNTSLHLACLHQHKSIVNYLLQNDNIDIHVKNNFHQTPMDIASSNEAISSLLDKFEDFCKFKELYSVGDYCKVFFVGSTGVGKSTIIEALRKNLNRKKSSLVDRFQTIKRYSSIPQTAGIVPMEITSEELGNCIFYDFAGQLEYHSCHSAILKSVSSSLSLLILVLNLSESEEEINKQLIYWLNLLVNECFSDTPIIIIGSHKDTAKNNQRKFDQLTKVTAKYPSLKVTVQYLMDCRQTSSKELANLVTVLSEQFIELRGSAPQVSIFCHALYAFLTTSIEDVALILAELVIKIHKKQDDFLPTDFNKLTQYLQTLHDLGLILFIPNLDNLPLSWIIFKKEAILSDVFGLLFSPDNLKLGDGSGIISLSELSSYFPQYPSHLLMDCLVHFDLCQVVIKPPKLLDLDINLTDSYTPFNTLLFFPALIKDPPPDHVWPPENTSKNSHYWFGWVLQCTNEQFFTSRFLHVLLLRLMTVFFVLSSSNATIPSTNFNISDFKYRCKIFKTGICWLHDEIWTMVQLTNNYRTLLFAMVTKPSNIEDTTLKIVKYRSNIMMTILKVRDQHCSSVPVHEFLLPSSITMQSNKGFELNTNENGIYRMKDVAAAILSNHECVIDVTGTTSINIKDVLLFDAYKGFNGDVLKKLFVPPFEGQVIKPSFIVDFVKTFYVKEDFMPLDLAVKIFQLDKTSVSRELEIWEGCVSSQYYDVVALWSESIKRSTHQDLHSILDQLSVFAGRNPLVNNYSALI